MEQGRDEENGLKVQCRMMDSRLKTLRNEGRVWSRSKLHCWCLCRVTSKKMMFSFLLNVNTDTAPCIYVQRIDFLYPWKRRAAVNRAIVGVLYAFSDETLMKAVCQNGSSSLLNNLNIKDWTTWISSSAEVMEPFHDFVSILQKPSALRTSIYRLPLPILSFCLHATPPKSMLSSLLTCLSAPDLNTSLLCYSCLPTCQSDCIIVSVLPMAWQQVMSSIWSNTQRETADFAIINSFLPKVGEQLIGLCEVEHHMRYTLKRDQMLRPSDHHTVWCLPHDERLKKPQHNILLLR